MERKITAFPAQPEFMSPGGHTFGHGGMSMEIKHTHPEYESRTARMEQLKDTQKKCMALLRMLRGAKEKGA